MLLALALRPAPRRGGRLPRAATPLAFAILVGCGPGANEREVVLGAALPLQYDYGVNARDGAQLAAHELNAAGIRVRLVIKDDGGAPGSAIAVAHELADDDSVMAVVGHTTSRATMAAAPLYSAAGVPAVALTATAPAIAQLGPWIFRVASSDSANASALARVAAVRGRKVAVLYANDEYGQELTVAFTAALRALGHQVVEEDPYLEVVPGFTPDFTPYLERLQRRGVDLVFLAGSDLAAAIAVRKARAMGLQMRFMGGDGIEGLALLGPVFDGTMIGLLFHPDASAESRRFTRAFRAAYGREPDSVAGLAYDAVRLLTRAARATGGDRARIREYLESVGAEGGAPPFEGVAGVIRFDARGDPVGKPFPVGVVRGGRVQLETASR